MYNHIADVLLVFLGALHCNRGECSSSGKSVARGLISNYCALVILDLNLSNWELYGASWWIIWFSFHFVIYGWSCSLYSAGARCCRFEFPALIYALKSEKTVFQSSYRYTKVRFLVYRPKSHKKLPQSFYKVCILTGNTAQTSRFLVKLHTL